jgi:hypothetical protein
MAVQQPKTFEELAAQLHPTSEAHFMDLDTWASNIFQRLKKRNWGTCQASKNTRKRIRNTCQNAPTGNDAQLPWHKHSKSGANGSQSSSLSRTVSAPNQKDKAAITNIEKKKYFT